MRLIDADAFLADSIKEKRFVFCSSDMLSEQVIVKTVYDELANALKHAPTVDAEPVRHGRWYKPKGMMPPEHHGRHRCSVCDHMAFYERLGREGLSDYCPNCGARMNGENNEP